MIPGKSLWRLRTNVCLGLLLASSLFPQTQPAPPPHRAAAPSRFKALADIVTTAIHEDQTPGAVLLVGHNGRVIYRHAFGERALLPQRERMTVGTIFDCASLTKVVATTPAVMQLFEEGKVRLDDPVARYLPGFGVNGKTAITVRELLTHYSGLPEDVSVSPPWHGYELGISKAFAVAPIRPPDFEFRYSDINFVVLGELVRQLSGETLDRYTWQHIFRPLGMNHTRFLPPVAWERRIAPTEIDPETGQWLRGTVHDPTARFMGGVAGNAGMFSTADDLARYAQALLNHGSLAGARILSRASVEKMTTPQTPYDIPDVRGLGWDIDSPFATNRGELLPVGSYGHTGFTGTSLWIDPYSNTYIVLLTNAVHPIGRPPLVELRSKIATAVAAVIDMPPATPSARTARRAALKRTEFQLETITGYHEVNSSRHRTLYRNGVVFTGLDVLKASGFAEFRGKRIGLITNPTGIDRDGNRGLHDMIAAGVNVTAAFSPEHGWAGKLDVPAIGNSVDQATGVPVFSAYGETAAQQHLPEDGVRRTDALVYDIQDIGVRFYTYETTLAYALESAAQFKKPIYVLDRPTMLDGIHVQGPALASAEKSFVGYYPGMPVRNGMTTGELAQMFNQTLHIGADLHVVKLQGWSRGDYFDETSLPWVNPSPNLRDLEQTILYPGVAIVEGTNVSVGRGTDTPFELLGAPWIQANQLAAYLNGRRIEGVRFVPTNFTPTSNRYANQLCHGVNIMLMNRDLLDAPEMGLEIASALAHLYPAQWETTEMHLLAGSQEIVDRIRKGDDPLAIAADYEGDEDAFRQLRAPFLLY